MFCSKCGNRVKDGLSFCPACGNRLTAENAPQVNPPQGNSPYKNPAGQPLQSPAGYAPQTQKPQKKDRSKTALIVCCVVLLLIVLGLGCGLFRYAQNTKGSQTAQESAVTEAAVTEAATIDVGVEISALMDDYFAAIKRGDADAVLACYYAPSVIVRHERGMADDDILLEDAYYHYVSNGLDSLQYSGITECIQADNAELFEWLEEDTFDELQEILPEATFYAVQTEATLTDQHGNGATNPWFLVAVSADGIGIVADYTTGTSTTAG